MAENSKDIELKTLSPVSKWHLQNKTYTDSRILFLRVPEIFTKRDCILGYKTNLEKCKRIEIIRTMVNGHNGNKLEINNRRYPNTCNLNHTLLYNRLPEDTVSGEIRHYLETQKQKHIISNFVGYS